MYLLFGLGFMTLISNILSTPVKCLSISFRFLPAWLDAMFSSGLEKSFMILNVPHPLPTPFPPSTHPYDSAFFELPPQPPPTPIYYYNSLAPKTCGWSFVFVFVAWIYGFVVNIIFNLNNKIFTPVISYSEQTLFWLLTCSGEICGFRIHGQNVPFEAVVLDKSTGEGVIRAKDKLDCELQKEHTFTIQAYDCGEGPDGANMKKSHKWVSLCQSTRTGTWSEPWVFLCRD